MKVDRDADTFIHVVHSGATVCTRILEYFELPQILAEHIDGGTALELDTSSDRYVFKKFRFVEEGTDPGAVPSETSETGTLIRRSETDRLAEGSGSIIVGTHFSNSGKDAWRWQGSGLVALPHLIGGSVVAAEGHAPDWNRVRYEMLTRLGYFVTESSEHFSEYTPWFIKRDRPDLVERFNVPLDEYIRRCEVQIAEWESMRVALEDPDPQAVTRYEQAAREERLRRIAAKDPQRAEQLRPLLSMMSGQSLRQQAAQLNDSGAKTAEGCAWTAAAVSRVRARLGL